MELIIGGDLVPTQSNIDLFSHGDVSALLGEELLGLWNNADMRIFNLEVPLCDKVDPIHKCGPNLIAPTNAIKGIKALKPSLITLANNHILDQGVQGLKSTETVLSENSIPYIGVGDRLSEACKPYILEREGRKIGVYACAEHEFSIASDNQPGANPFDPLESLDHIVALKAECDYVIVLYHGGKEHYRYPSPYLQKLCRKMAEKGADIVVCQHSHCIGAWEEYKGKTIVYGQGNFIFDGSELDFWQTSLLLRVIISEKLSVQFIPICKKGNHIKLANNKEREDIWNSFFERSRQIIGPCFVENEYNKFCVCKGEDYLWAFSAFGRVIRKIDRFLNGKLIRGWYNEKKMVVIRNFIECEAHRELVLRFIRLK